MACLETRHKMGWGQEKCGIKEYNERISQLVLLEVIRKRKYVNCCNIWGKMQDTVISF